MTQAQQIIFDLDGTLIHSAPDMHVAANQMLQAMGRPQIDLPTAISFIGNGVEVLMQRCLCATGGTSPALEAKARALFMERYEGNGTALTRPYPGVVDCLEALAARGVAMAVCTNKPGNAARHICDDLDLTRFFKVVVGAEDSQPKKPDPKPLLDTIAGMGGDVATTLYVGDSAVDYETALAAKVPFRLFNGGYLKGPLPDLAAADRFDDWADSGL